MESEYLIIHLVAMLEELSKSGDFNDQLIAELMEKTKEVLSPDLHALFEHEVVQQVKHLRRTLETNFLDSFTGHWILSFSLCLSLNTAFPRLQPLLLRI